MNRHETDALTYLILKKVML